MAYKILNTELESIELSNTIHEWLKENRQGYNASKWSDLNKSDSENKWAVSIPHDYIYEGETVESLPDNWVVNEELL